MLRQSAGGFIFHLLRPPSCFKLAHAGCMWVYVASMSGQVGSSRPQVGPKTPQDSSMLASSGLKLPQVGLKLAQVGLKMALDGHMLPQEGSMLPQVGPTWPQVALTWFQLGLKLAPCWPREAPGGSPEGSWEGPGRLPGGTWSQEALLEAPEVPKWLPNDLQELQNDPKLIPKRSKFEPKSIKNMT